MHHLHTAAVVTLLPPVAALASPVVAVIIVVAVVIVAVAVVVELLVAVVVPVVAVPGPSHCLGLVNEVTFFETMETVTAVKLQVSQCHVGPCGCHLPAAHPMSLLLLLSMPTLYARAALRIRSVRPCVSSRVRAFPPPLCSGVNFRRCAVVSWRLQGSPAHSSSSPRRGPWQESL